MRADRTLCIALLAGMMILAAISVAPAQTDQASLGGPRADATEVDRKIFLDGRRQFSRAWDEHDGVGDRFNEHSCLGCHSVPAAGGSGVAANTFVVVSNDIADAGGGHVFRRFQRMAGNVTVLLAPAGSSRRKAPILFGVGLLDAVELRQLTTPVPGPDKIIGRVGGTVTQPGRFGWKARVPDLKTFVATAFVQELGLGGKAGDETYPDIAIEEVAAFVRLLGPPPRRQEIDDRAKAGERIFAEIGCAQCHKPSLRLGRQAEAELGHQPEIRAYTDLLLHNMGSELADGIVEGKAGGADFRTPPLWGVSASGPPYLHDGRAHDLSEAIGMHDGEARNTRLRWEGLSPADRDALISFLGTL
ncbi:MAG TPA: di-heme oxidoredictase family protein [Stellaceae bacterium]|nr:di-heme oxidoredictase family protein [Stellaceae bacterium]